jgi:hypothetical protein
MSYKLISREACKNSIYVTAISSLYVLYDYKKACCLMVLLSRLCLQPARCDVVIRSQLYDVAPFGRQCLRAPAFTLRLVLHQHTSAAQSTYLG